MTKFNLDDMTRGWFVGNFSPTAYLTDSCEVAIKHYKKDDYEQKHFHKIATEITVISSGTVRIGEEVYTSGDIIRIEPGTAVDFLALSDTTTVVVKIPGAPDDKYLSSAINEPKSC
jgi:hypothetical protein